MSRIFSTLEEAVIPEANLGKAHYDVDIALGDESLVWLKDCYSILDVSYVKAKISLSRHKQSIYAKGKLEAELEQECVVTLLPVKENIEQDFVRKFIQAPPESEMQDHSDEWVVTMDDEDWDIIENGQIDLGKLLIEEIALAMQIYPRHETADKVKHMQIVDEAEAEAEAPGRDNPFTVLKSLKVD